MSPRDLDWHRLDQYLTQQGTPGELEALRQWVEADPERRALAERLRAAGRPPREAPYDWNTRATWQQLHRQMRLADRPPLRLAPEAGGEASGRRRLGARVRRWVGVVAAAAVVLTAGIAVLQVTPPTRQPAIATPAPMREITTRRGQRATFNLPDGSRVIVAAASRLRIPRTYQPSSGARDVFLEGEAYFEVEHDTTRPFRVHAANAVAEDLGTEFVVTAYPETQGIQVVVASGAVALRTADTLRAQPRALLTLTRGDLGRLDAVGSPTLTRNVNVAAHLAWIRGGLTFNVTPLREVLPQLARWYDLDIRLADSTLGDRRLTATIRWQSAEEVVDLVALSLGLRVEQTGSRVVLSKR